MPAEKSGLVCLSDGQCQQGAMSNDDTLSLAHLLAGCLHNCRHATLKMSIFPIVHSQIVRRTSELTIERLRAATRTPQRDCRKTHSTHTVCSQSVRHQQQAREESITPASMSAMSKLSCIAIYDICIVCRIV